MKPIGYQKIIEMFGLVVHEPATVSWLRSKGSERISRLQHGREEEIYPPRYDPGDRWQDNLAFAIKHEGVNLEALEALFQKLPIGELIEWVKSAPHSRYVRVAWFLYEWFGNPRLQVPDLTQGNYIPVLDEKRCYSLQKRGEDANIRRQRVIDNLPGNPAYCCMIRRTPALERYESERMDERAKLAISKYPKDLLQRATRFLYVKETKSSFAIEKMEPDQKRTARFIGLLEQAGRLDCYSKKELIKLQNAIVEARYAAPDYRDFQNYVGQSLGPAREYVHFIPPKPEDLAGLMDGWMESCRRLEAGGVHPVITAAVAGYGFVFLHPFEDGNGRLHRFLIQHALSAGGFGPNGVLFPVSATILKQMAKYDASLEAYSRRISQFVDYKLDEQGAMTVSGDTRALYRFPDLTAQAEALFGFIEDTISQEMVAELDFLTVYDAAKSKIRNVVDMPDRRLDLFLRICLEGKGNLSKTKRSLFKELTNDEVKKMQEIVKAAIAEIPKKILD